MVRVVRCSRRPTFPIPTWQGSVTDQQIAAAIKFGKGAMPAFKLPDVTIANLVKLVRMMNIARLQGHAAAAPSTGAAPSSAPTPSGSAPTPSGSAPKPHGTAPHPAPKPSAN